MSIFVPNKNVSEGVSYGQAINKALKEYVQPELKHRGMTTFSTAGIEILKGGKSRVFLDGEVEVFIEFKNGKINPGDVGKDVKVSLEDIKDIGWQVPKTRNGAARIFLTRFNQDWWIWDANLQNKPDLVNYFKTTQTFTVRGGGHLPLKIRKQQKDDFTQGWRKGLTDEIPKMWKRHITVSQRYSGAMVYDGNYFDIFVHAQEMFVLGYFYTSVILCRTAAEQALIQILIKSGKGLDIYKRGTRRLKSIEELVEACRNYSLFGRKPPISKISAKKLNAISTTASELVHPKNDLKGHDSYKEQALDCMDGLYSVIRKHLNFVKDTGVVSGYRLAGNAKRLK